ncbi:fumarylacetoacetate hydrolase family protein [Pseudonocardia sp. NPDC049635]|uniref:fumarylacetoacetate hydrolase family protein n=1 Tax=Pseudonocardia sp. NPDC049635 TaxID=3155506 RepID=UPI0033EBD229
MRFASLIHEGRTIVTALDGDRLHDLSGLLPQDRTSTDPMVELLRVGLPDEQTAFAQPELPGPPVYAPLVSQPGKVIAAPVNYRDHQEEMQQIGNVSALGFFLMSPSSVAPHGGVVRLPYTDRRFDQEGELALLIGKDGRDIAPDRIAEHIAGYTCLIDMTMRGGEDRSTRKSFDTFTPIGPHLVTPDEVGDLGTITLRTWVNGEIRQDADIADLIWDVPRFVSYVSSVTKLLAGDVITTGTPAGVGTVADGDEVTVTIERVGTLEVSVSTVGALPCPTGGAGSGPKPPETLTPVRQRRTTP